MLREVVVVLWCLFGIAACVITFEMCVKIIESLSPCIRSAIHIQLHLQERYEEIKEERKKRRAIYPVIVYDIPVAEITHVQRIPYPASLVSTVAVEIV